MHSLIRELTDLGPTIVDGAWGTQLHALGLPMESIPDFWNLEQPDRVLAVAQAYVEAGSRIILTNTFGANRIRLAETGRTSDVPEINRQGVWISRQAAADRARVFASVGPTGKMLLTGEATAADFEKAFEEQISALMDARPDGFVIETMSDLAEARIAVNLARRTGLPVVACMVFDSGRNKDRTMMGVTTAQAAETLAAEGADVIGANCGQGIETFVPLCRQLRAATSLPLWMKPNAGLPEIAEGRAVYRMTPDRFAAQALLLLEAGADFVGGCCGTTPEYVRALSQIVRQHLAKASASADGASGPALGRPSTP